MAQSEDDAAEALARATQHTPELHAQMARSMDVMAQKLRATRETLQERHRLAQIARSLEQNADGYTASADAVAAKAAEIEREALALNAFAAEHPDGARPVRALLTPAVQRVLAALERAEQAYAAASRVYQACFESGVMD